jgi:hypothetical protein
MAKALSQKAKREWRDLRFENSFLDFKFTRIFQETVPNGFIKSARRRVSKFFCFQYSRALYL